MTAHDDLATLRDALLEAGREIHAHSDHPERIDFAAVLAEIDKAIAAARRVEAEIARLEERANFADAYAYRQRAEAADAENARLRDALFNHGYGPRLCRCEWCALLADQDGAACPDCGHSLNTPAHRAECGAA